MANTKNTKKSLHKNKKTDKHSGAILYGMDRSHTQKSLFTKTQIKNLIEMGEASSHIYKFEQQTMVNYMTKMSAETVGADASIWWVHDPRRKRFIVRGSYNVSQSYIHAWNEVMPLTTKTGLMKHVKKGGPIVYSENVLQTLAKELNKEELETLRKEKIYTIVVIPYNLPSFKTWGAVNLYWRTPRSITAEDMERFKLLQEQVYFALDSIKHSWEYARQKPQITALYKIFGGGVNLEKALPSFEQIIANLGHTLRAHAGALWLRDQGSDALTLFASTGFPQAFLQFSESKEGKITTSQGFIAELIKTHAASFSALPTQKSKNAVHASFIEQHLNPNYANFLQTAGLTNLITPFFVALPLFIEEHIAGALIFYFRTPRSHSVEELHTLHVTTSYIGTALANARLYETLAKETSKLEALFASLDVAVANLDQQGRFVKLNPWGERLFSKSQQELIGKTPGNVDGSSLLASVVNLFSIEEIRDHKHLSKELWWDTPPRVFEVSATSVEGTRGEFFGVTYFTRDITQERLLEGMKTEFISLAAHQIRSPLTGIKWSLRSVLDKDLGELTPQEQMMLEKTYASTERLIQLTKELLDVSRIEGGRFFKPKSPLNLDDIIKEVVEGSTVQAQERNIKLEYLPPQQKVPEIMGDKNAIRELVRILVDNAIRYTLQGGWVRIHMTKDEQSITIVVKDTGIGIPQAEQPYLFTRFFRATNARQTTEGTGLGLYFARRVAQEYKGKIWFESQEKVGTAFYVSFPLPHKRP